MSYGIEGCVTFRRGREVVLNVLKENWPNQEEWIDHISDLLEIIQTNICGPFPNATMDGLKYFISFINDFSWYAYFSNCW